MGEPTGPKLAPLMLKAAPPAVSTTAGAPTLLSAFREWLRPLAGADLPSQQVREAVYAALAKLPVEVDHLKTPSIPFHHITGLRQPA